MSVSLLRTDEELSQIYHRHVNTIYRVCFLYMKNTADAEDMVQATFVRLMEAGPAFVNSEHEKAWLIRTAVNLCLNQLRHWWRRTVGMDEVSEAENAGSYETDETLQKVLSLSPKYKTAIYLHYYEGYSAVEIARLLGKSESTVRGHLFTGRRLLKMEMEDELG